jgi:hypothetical protein
MIFTSCKYNSKGDLNAIKVLNEGLVNSNKSLDGSITELMHSLESKLYDYPSKERALIWLPKAKAIQKISGETINKIESIRSELEINPEKKFEISNTSIMVQILSQYERSILQIDSILTKDYNKYLRIFTKSMDSSDSRLQKFKEYFSDVSSIAAIAMLNKIENNIKLNEEGMITYCHEMSTPIFCGIRNSFAAIAILNTSLVEPKGKLEITAGLGSFSVYQSPKVYFYDRSFDLTEDGAAHYKFKAASDPGKYYVPVRIEYIDENGKQNVIKKQIEYTVANIQKQ